MKPSFHVMTVDDSATIRKMLSMQLPRIFQQYEFKMIEAENGQDAWDKLQNNPEVKLILCDWNMPIMPGDVFIQKVREDARYKKLRIVMITTEGERKKVLQMLKNGVNGYIVKPFTPEAIQKNIQPLLDRLIIE